MLVLANYLPDWTNDYFTISQYFRMHKLVFFSRYFICLSCPLLCFTFCINVHAHTTIFGKFQSFFTFIWLADDPSFVGSSGYSSSHILKTTCHSRYTRILWIIFFVLHHVIFLKCPLHRQSELGQETKPPKARIKTIHILCILISCTNNLLQFFHHHSSRVTTNQRIISWRCR